MELLAKNALKMTVTERKRTYRMLLQARIISQMKDMNAMTNEFLKAVQVISKDIAASAGLDIAKITGDLKFAMDKFSADGRFKNFAFKLYTSGENRA